MLRSFAYLGHNSCDIDIGTHNSGVVTSQFEGHTLEGGSAGGRDLFSAGHRPGETDLRDSGVCREHWSQVISAAKDVEDALGEDLGAYFSKLKRSIGTIGRGLPDEGVSDQERGDELDDPKQHWEVPWHYTDTDAQRDVPQHNAQLQVPIERLAKAMRGNEACYEV